MSSRLRRCASALRSELARRLVQELPPGVADPTPRVSAATRMVQARIELFGGCDGFLRRAAIEASLTPDERREILRGMLLTRATDTRLKTFFTGGDAEVRQRRVSRQRLSLARAGSGVPPRPRAACGAAFCGADGRWMGDVVAPVIRDLGVALAMEPDAAAVRGVLSAQMGKSGPPMDGKDLHIGDFARGVLPPAAPLAIAALTAAGMAMAFSRDGSARVAVSFIGEGGSSLGEWHEAINLCAAQHPAGDFLHRKQPDGPLDASGRPIRSACVRGQGGRLRDSGHHD